MRSHHALEPSDAGAAPYESGRVFGHYEITRCVGVGAMGAVYEATHLLLKKPVAVKILHPRLRGSNESQARFLREAEIAAKVRHRNIVYITDVGVEQDVCYLVMELLEGEDLATRLARDGALGVVDAVDTVISIAAGLAAVHGEGIVHRDVKPENILLATESDQIVPKLIDFGVSKDLLTSSPVQTIAGTPTYMAPEQATGAPVDGRADEYSLAVIAYECLTGRVPFESSSLLGLMQLIEAGEYRAIRELNPGVPPELETAIVRAMAVNPEDRFPTAALFGKALLPFASAPMQARLLPELSSADDEQQAVSKPEPPVVGEPTMNASPAGEAAVATRRGLAIYPLLGFALIAMVAFALYFSRPVASPVPSVSAPLTAVATVFVPLPVALPSVATVAATTEVAPQPAPSASAPRRSAVTKRSPPSPSSSVEAGRGLGPKTDR